VIAVVAEGEQEQGYHNVPWRAETASGMYFYKLIATSLVDAERQYAATKRLMIIR
jgi:hypothetical protein